MADVPGGSRGFARRVGGPSASFAPGATATPVGSASAGQPASPAHQPRRSDRRRPAEPRRHERHDASRAGRAPAGAAASRGRRPDRLADDDRPQEDRDPLHDVGLRDVHGRRPACGRDADRARSAGPPADDRGGLQPAVHDARHDHAAAVRDADGDRTRQLHRPAPDRRRGHGVPTRERLVVLDVPVRRARRHEQLPGPRRSGRGRLDELRPAQRPDLGAGCRSRPVDRRAGARRFVERPWVDQLHRHDLHHARTGDAPVSDADLHLEHPRDRASDPLRLPGPHRGAGDALHRPAARWDLLRAGARRRRRCCGSTCSGSSAIPRSTS